MRNSLSTQRKSMQSMLKSLPAAQISRQGPIFGEECNEMANSRAFISFDYDNIKNSMTPFSVEDWSSKEILLQSQWERLIKEKIDRCHLMIVLIGNSMANATGVKKKIRFSDEQDVPYFGVYVGRSSITSTLLSGRTRNRIIRWNWHLISIMVDRMMREGKNTAQGKRS